MADQKPIEQHQVNETMSHLEDVKSENPVTLYRTYSLSEAAAIEKQLVRKIDGRILPTIVLIYILNYVSSTLR